MNKSTLKPKYITFKHPSDKRELEKLERELKEIKEKLNKKID
jgi:hypothetical protein